MSIIDFVDRAIRVVALVCLALPLNAADQKTGTDADLDAYTIKLTGPGTLQVNPANGSGPITSIAVSGTNHTSALSVTVRPAPGAVGPDVGKVAIGAVTGAGSLKSISAAKSDLVGAGIALGGGLGSVKLANISNGADITAGLDAKLKTTSLTAGAIGAIEVTTPAKVFKLGALSVAGAKFSAVAVGAFKVTAGSAVADIEASGKLVSFLVKGGDFTGHIDADTIGSIRVARNKAGTGGSILDSHIAARSIGPVSIDGDLIDSFLMAGADFGADHEFGGTGADADTFGIGSLKSFVAKGNVTNSIIGAGFSPVDGVFGDANDGAIGGRLSRIRSFSVALQLDAASLIGAGLLPKKVSVNGVKFAPLTNAQFISRAIVVPPDPAMTATPLDPTESKPAASATEFLYTGKNAIQTGVAPGTIKPEAASVLRGRVITREGTAIAGVKISILDHAEFGETHSRADGMFDLAVNGGGTLVVKFETPGLCPVQRSLDTTQQDFETLGDVAMIGVDPLMTPVALGAGSAMQMHAASMQSDASGDRHAALMFQPDTSAMFKMADGTMQAAPATLSIRATEFTVGPNGPNAMPGVLPPNSAYTYCAELTADETPAGATLEFTKPVFLYVENFLNFETGIDVPSGFYNAKNGVWEAGPSGKIIKIVSETGGAADLDVTGDNVADTGATLTAVGITDEERTQLASNYAVGQSLWRVPIPHFSPWDCNWPFGPPPGAQPPGPPPPTNDDPPDDCDDPPNIYLQNQAMGERLRIAGVPYTLNYRSSRVLGRSAAARLSIPLSGSSIPASLKRIEREVSVGGRTFVDEFAPGTNLGSTFQWDGLDAYDRPVFGRQTATVRIGYVYDGDYMRTNRFGVSGNGVAITGDRTRQEITLSTTAETQVGQFDIRRQSIGGWTFDVHHVYDPSARKLYLGDGNTRSVESVSAMIRTAAGSGQNFTPGFNNDGIPASQGRFTFPFGLAVAPDSSFTFADPFLKQVFTVGTDGIQRVIVGTGVAGFNGDNQPARQAQVSSVEGLARGRDGTVYFCDFDNARIRSVTPDGMIHTIAGTGVMGFSGDEGPATSAMIRGCIGISVGPDGTVYIADGNNHRIRAIGTDGIIRTIAGNGNNGYNGDNIPATTASLSFPQGVAADEEGNVFIADTGNRVVRVVGPDGIIRTFAGQPGQLGDFFDPDGVSALQAKFHSVVNVFVDAEGAVVATDPGSGRVRRITRDGKIAGLAGSGELATDAAAANGEGGPALQALLRGPFPGSPYQGLQYAAAGPDGTVWLSDSPNRRIRKLDAPLPGFSGGDISIPSEDGSELYRFDSSGRHLATLNAYTGATILTFGYDSDGQLVKITDVGNNVTTIQRSSGGAPVAIIGPGGHKSTLATDANGSLTMIRDPVGGTHQFTNTDGGLITSETDPLGHTHTFTYDAAGLLTKGDHAGPAFTDLARVEIPGGYFIDADTALGATGRYQVENPPTGAEIRTNTASTGLVQTWTKSEAGVETLATADGVVETTTRGPDPRFAFSAPVDAIQATALPGGQTLTLETARTAMLSNPMNPLSLTAFTETLTVNGAAFTTTYNPTTRTFVNTSAEGRTNTGVIDAFGRPVSIQDGSLNAFTFVYDSRSHLTTFLTGAGAQARTTRFSYNGDGELASFTDPLNQRWTFDYDAAGRVKQRQAPDGGRTMLGYDAAGNSSSVTPPGRPAHLLAFGNNGLISSYTAPDAGGGPAVTSFSYNAHQSLSQIARPGGETIAYGYDAGGRVATRTVAAGTTTFAYNATTGALASVTQANGDALALTFNGPFELSSTWTGTVAGNVSRTLDDRARTDTQTVNGAGSVAFTYDADWLVTGAGPLTLTRDSERGIVTGTTLGAVSDTRGFNGFGELTNYTASHGGTALISLQHSYDKNGRVTQIVETVGAAAPDTFAFAYDRVGRLIEERKNGALQHTYTYDANGNRLTTDGVVATYDAQDRLTASGAVTFTYKPSGDLVSKAIPGQTTTYTYDALGNLTAVALPGGPAVSYVIDGLNRRIGRRLNGVFVQGFLYQDGLNIVGELDGANQLVSRFVYADRDDVPAFMFKGGDTFRIIADRLGSVRLVVNAVTGAIAQRLDYDAFGNVLLDSNPGFQPFGFAGGHYDPDTKLVRFGARDYDPAIGRWTAKEPLLFSGLETNLYAYAGNDPVNFFDPEGLDIVSVGFYQAVIVPGHSTISVNGSPYQGFYPDNGGKIVYEGQQLKRNPDYRIRFKVTPEQAKRIKKFIEDQKKKGRSYDVLANNCAHFVRDALQAGGVVRNGRGYAYSPSQLFRELFSGGGSFAF